LVKLQNGKLMLDTSVLLAKVGTEIQHENKTYIISDLLIIADDLIWNEPSRKVDKCISVLGDYIVIEMDNGMRASFWKKRYQKLIKK